MNAHQGNGGFSSCREQEVSVDQPNRRIKFPDRKISETFLDFAHPLLEPLGPGATVEQMEQILELACTVWNAVVYEDVNGNSRYIDMARNLTRQDRENAALVHQLIARKRNVFGDDDRLVGEFKLTLNGGEIRLRAEARDPTRTNSKAK